MKVPSIHLNGTPQDRLPEQAMEAAGAVGAAVEKLAATAPNGRDYYPQGDGAVSEALSEHYDRLSRLESVRRELEDLALAIADGGFHG